MPTAMRAGQPQPSRVGPYRILTELGRGGMGVVYRGEHLATGEPAAIKTVSAARPHDMSSLRREIHALIQLQHPGVVRFIEQGIDQGRPWYAMELLERRTLEDLRDELFPGLRRYRILGHDAVSATGITGLGEQETLALDGAATTQTALVGHLADGLMPEHDTGRATAASSALQATGAGTALNGNAGKLLSRPVMPYEPGNLKRTLNLAYRLCRILAFIHDQGIVHRDLKPSNVFLRAGDAPILTDFGLVARVEGEHGREVLQISGGLRGTPGYMAPEQILGHSVDARADLYALGCLLYELLTGTPPFTSKSPVDLLLEHLHTPVQSPSERVSGLLPALDPLILQLLAKQRRDRIGHADDVAAALIRLGADRETAGDSPTRNVSSTPRSYLYRPEMVGRNGLMSSLELRIQQLRAGRGGMILVGGESGAGKTYLATALTATALRHEVQVVIGECQPAAAAETGARGLDTVPLHPFRQLLHTIADRCVEGGPEVTERLLGTRAQVLATYEPLLATLPGMSTYAEPAELPPEAAQTRLMNVLGQVLADFVAESPLLLVLDDLQWADALSMQFLLDLAEADLGPRRLLVLGTYRTEEMSQALQSLLEASWIEKVTLDRLDDDAIGIMVRDMLGMRWSPGGLVRFLTEQSRGNPFFVTEYMRAAVAEGILYREGGRWRMGDGSKVGSLASYQALPLPRSLEALMSRRLTHLSPSAQHLLELASVLGHEMEAELLLVASELAQRPGERTEPERLDGIHTPGKEPGRAAIGELLRRQVLEQRQDDRLRFVHDTLRETAIARIAPARLPALHRAAGEAIEVRYAGEDDVALHYPDLVRHWKAAGDHERTLHYLARAGQHAMHTAAHAEATRFLEEALDLHEMLGRPGAPLHRIRWERQLGEAYLALGENTRSRLHLERAVALCGVPMPQNQQELKVALAREALIQLSHRIGLRPGLAGSLPADLTEAARSYALLNEAYRASGHSRSTRHATHYAIIRALNLAERGAAPTALAMSYSGAQAMVAALPLPGLAGRYGKLAHRTLDGVDAPSTRALVLLTSAMFHLGTGNWVRAMESAEASARIAEATGFRRRFDEASMYAAYACMASGSIDRAAQIYRRIYRSAMQGSDTWARARILTHMIHVNLAQGRLEGASSRLAEVEAMLHAGRLEPVDELHVHAAAARVRLHERNPVAAHRAAKQALARMRALPPILIELLMPCAALIEVLSLLTPRQAGRGEARILARAAGQAFTFARALRRSFPIMAPDLLYWQGTREMQSGRCARAQRYWNKSLAAAISLGMPYQEARARLALSRVLGHSAATRLHASRATALLVRLGVPREAIERMLPEFDRARS